jgi:hypothetical protein
VGNHEESHSGGVDVPAEIMNLAHCEYVRRITSEVGKMSLHYTFAYSSNPPAHLGTNTGCFKRSSTALKAYINLYRGHTQRFELS